jgi:hypothetical protein
MQVNEKLSLEQIQAFLEGSGEIVFEGRNRQEVYSWVNRTLQQQRLRRTRAKREGAGKAISGEDDGAGPRADYAAGDDVSER